MSKTVSQVIGFDFGLRHIGVATGNTKTAVASELTVLMAKNGQPDWDEIKRLFSEWQPELVLVGLPLNMDDSESELSGRARKFAKQIQGRFGLKIEMVDERLSSFEAKLRARDQGHGGDYKAAPIDALAARILIEQWLSLTDSKD